MRKAILIIISILLTYSYNTYAQGGAKGSISGKVTDATTKQPVDYATVSVFKQGSASPFNGMSTDAKGSFKIDNVPAGDYKVTVDFLGYQKTTIEHVIVGGNPSTSVLNNILLQPSSKQLQTVNVVAKAPIIENRIDKTVYNAANDLTSQGGVAIDVLKKVPQVTVDIDGNVELQGNANVRFLINGKPSSIFGASLADALQAIPASQIKSIEVITSPGARYDAAGTGGIINIILKDNKVQGINGSINLAAATRRENGSFNFSARKGNVGINAFFSGNAQLNTTVLSNSTRTSTDADGNVSTLAQNGSASSKRSGYQSGLSFNWSITPKDEFTATIGFNHFGNSNVGLTNQLQQQYDAANTLLSTLASARNSDSRFSANAIDWSLGYKKNFKTEGQTLEFLFNSSRSNNTSRYSQQQDYPTGGYPSTGSRANNPGKDRETNISLDYVQPVTKSFTLETGAKVVINNLSNSVVTDSLLNDGSYINNADQTYGFNYKRNIYAAYVSATFSVFNKFLDLKPGLRNEYTTTTADFQNVTIPSYNTLVPSMVLSHKFNDAQSIKLSYNYRIERPDYRDVNPFYNISDPYNISTGNPNLKPEKSNSLELGFNQSFNSGASFSANVFYRHNSDDLQDYSTRYDVLTINGRDYYDVLLSQRANIGTQTSVGGSLFASVPVTSKFNLRSNVFLISRNNNNPGIANVTGFGYRINLNASYQFGNDLTAEAFGNYNSSQRVLQGTRPQFFFYNFAVRKQFMDKKASIGLMATNPFGLYVNQRSVTEGVGFRQLNLRQLPFQSFGITLSYKFGKLEFSKNKGERGNGEGGENMPSAPEGGGTK